MIHARALVAISLLVAAPASACPSGADFFSFSDAPSAPTPRLREHGGRAIAAIGLSPDFLWMGVDGDRLQAWGARVEARVQHRELAVVLDAALYKAVQADPGARGEPGSLARVGAELRWEPIAWRMDASAAIAPFVELGVGMERWTFAEASTRSRPDASVGLGLHVHGGSMDPRNTRHIGVTLVSRLITARGTEAPDLSARTTTPATTSPTHQEVGVEVGLAVTFGRRGHP